MLCLTTQRIAAVPPPGAVAVGVSLIPTRNSAIRGDAFVTSVAKISQTTTRPSLTLWPLNGDGWGAAMTELHFYGGQIIVNLSGTRLTMTFEVSSREPRLLENKFWTRDDGNAEFRMKALEEATMKARELGWLRNWANAA